MNGICDICIGEKRPAPKARVGSCAANVGGMTCGKEICQEHATPRVAPSLQALRTADIIPPHTQYLCPAHKALANP
jgi:hypothetical protein